MRMTVRCVRQWPARAAVVIASLATGCATGPSYLDAAQSDAVRMAELRAQSELGCSDGKGTITHRETLAGPPPQSVGYTVLVAACGQRSVFVVRCTERQGCYTGAGRPVR
jgi:hypothetical protein